ncbi:uncharacterized protein LOC102715646 [Oryza brachyantha]|uniref:F-box associated domain-containing protein n=1 Tax=Oryza brachyantha TaxID=4533 RepID=J3LDM9_ORYBR|nr:uncharacterized protein LOC102715646 [Oryza brachyantha]
MEEEDSGEDLVPEVLDAEENPDAAGDEDMPDVESTGSNEDALPEVDQGAFYHVLIRMSAAEVRNAAAVSRTVRDLVRTDAFRRDHHRHSSSHMPLFFYRYWDYYLPAVVVNLCFVDIAARVARKVIYFADAPDPPIPSFDPRAFIIEGSCDGILLFSYRSRLYAFNPCTRHWGNLPPLHLTNEIVAFYGHGPLDNREYRVLYHPMEGQFDSRYWIFSPTFPDQPPRCIGRAVNMEVVDLSLERGITPSYEMPPVTVGQRLHWRPQIGQYNHNVLVFDTVAEVFDMIPPPRMLEGDLWVDVDGDQLLEINDKLAMTFISRERVDVWVLQEGEVWAHQYQIPLPVPQLAIFEGYDDEGFLSAAVFAVSEQRNALVQCPAIILHCDTGGDVLKFYSRTGNLTVLSRYTLQESLLEHPFLPMRRSDINHPQFFL